jgi:ribosomal protein L7/L12
MRLDKIKFARLITHIQYWISKGYMLSEADIDDIDYLCQVDVEPVETDKAEATIYSDSIMVAAEVNELLKQIVAPDGFISAIEIYSSLTGASLLDSNGIIEQYRNILKFKHSAPTTDNVYSRVVDVVDINRLMLLMHEGINKTGAIEIHSKLTGWGLKESTDKVEQYWISKGTFKEAD